MGASTTDARELHAKLWALIRNENIDIRHNARCTSPDAVEAGFFHPNIYGRFGPTIQLWRTRADTVDDYAQELITLAHEYGHAISHRRGERPRIDMPEPSPNLPEEEKQVVEEEEERAWKYGREVLASLTDGKYDCVLFEERKRIADAVYAQRLGR